MPITLPNFRELLIGNRVSVERRDSAHRAALGHQAAWNQYDKEEVEDWKAEGGWLHELADDTLP